MMTNTIAPNISSSTSSPSPTTITITSTNTTTVPDDGTTTKQPQQQSQQQPQKSVKPQIFAIMRNGHEVIRGSMNDMKHAIEIDKDIMKAKEIWTKLIKFESIHKRMEEGCTSSEDDNSTSPPPMGFFKVLDENVDNIVTKAGLYDAHIELESYEVAVTNALQQQEDDLDTLQITYRAFMEENEHHLKQEEDIMMPSIMKLMKNGAPLKKYMCQEILPTLWWKNNNNNSSSSLNDSNNTNTNDDLEFFIKYANEILEKYSTNELPRVRVFNHALWAVAEKNEQQWSLWNQWIQETISKESYTELQQFIL